MKANGEKPHFSKTQLEMLSRCGMQYFFRYVEGIKAPPGVALVKGKAVHAAVEKDLLHKREKGELLTTDAVRDIAAEALDTNWLGDEPALDEEEQAIGPKVIQARAKDEVVALASLHHLEVAPGITPTWIEREFRLELAGFPYDLKGVIDIQEPGAVRDTKTSGKTPSQDAAETSLQLSLYHLAAQTLDGKAPEVVALDYLVNTRSPKVEIRTSTRTPEDHRRVLNLVERAAKVVQAGAFMPADPDHWMCSGKYCGYWQDRCPFGRRNRLQV